METPESKPQVKVWSEKSQDFQCFGPWGHIYSRKEAWGSHLPQGKSLWHSTASISDSNSRVQSRSQSERLPEKQKNRAQQGSLGSRDTVVKMQMS